MQRIALFAAPDIAVLLVPALIAIEERHHAGRKLDRDRARGRATRSRYGASAGQLALRLRYEIRRKLVQYVGIVCDRVLGNTEDRLRANRRETEHTQVVTNIRMLR